MPINQTLEKLHSMRLTGLAEALTQQLEDPDSSVLSFEERIGWLIDRHWLWRENQVQARRLKNAHLKDSQACLEDIDYRPARGLDRSLVRSLATCDWITRHQNLILLGPCGVGKTFLACAFAQQAIRQGHTAFYTRQPVLFRELSMARADGTLHKLLAKLARVEILIVDDFAMTALAESERRDFLEICEDRYNTRSTILTSQIPIADWHQQIGDPTLADSILDRLVHNAHRLQLEGGSMRKRSGGFPRLKRKKAMETAALCKPIQRFADLLRISSTWVLTGLGKLLAALGSFPQFPQPLRLLHTHLYRRFLECQSIQATLTQNGHLAHHEIPSVASLRPGGHFPRIGWPVSPEYAHRPDRLFVGFAWVFRTRLERGGLRAADLGCHSQCQNHDAE